MKLIPLLFAFVFLISGLVRAQQAPPAPQPIVPTNSPAFLTQAEWQEMRAARTAALAAHPELNAKTQSLFEQLHAVQEKIDAAMLAADPTLAPILDKYKAHAVRPAPVPVPAVAPAK